ncbi:MAG: PstS family phosphate ABC transporter substrate-binding protein [Leptospira sp.]|nr:PstS family phosphate ABC transporter substrate-binding protein [Leptospira sp.]NCS92666.1 PstS family phosphate ABC transporter substrate-binding protein [Leptospira sp.]
MKQSLIILLTIVLFNCGPKEVITITGSETMHGMAEYLGNEFEKENSKIKVQVFGGGSLEGITKLISGETNIALSSRDLQEKELASLSKKGDLEKLTIAYDGVAIVVHPSNPIAKLDLKSISNIFQGKIQNWKQVGGLDKPIQVIVRNDKSGTLSYFTDHILKQKDLGIKEFEKNKNNDYISSAKTVSDNNDMADFIAKNPNAIGFMGMGSANLENKGKLKALSYAIQPSDPFIEPSIENVYNRKYRMSRALYMIYRADSHEKVDAFSSFLTSEVGQELILKRGYLRASLPEVEVKAE